jgi:hypothetical protein
MAGLVPAIHVLTTSKKDVDARHEAGHDEQESCRHVIPIVISVALVCFLLVHITPGDPLVAILPADASQELASQLRIAYGFDRPLPV